MYRPLSRHIRSGKAGSKYAITLLDGNWENHRETQVKILDTFKQAEHASYDLMRLLDHVIAEKHQSA
ncbi:MAG: hypothetical protein RQ783_08740 [Gammaproteobacteria bacterium]|nr:hypothetical protein [Gammaproteobacteria bacterium]